MEVRFHVEGNSSTTFAGRTALAEKNVTWETNFMVVEKKREQISDQCKSCGIAPQNGCSASERHAVVMHTKAQPALWFRTLDVSRSTQWYSE